MGYDTYPTPRAELEERIVFRARNDSQFRERLLREPRRAVAEALGCQLPERLSIRVVEERPDLMCMLGIDGSAGSIDVMCHPERSPYARVGPEGATGGQDPSFLRNPARRSTTVPEALDLPEEWVFDPWSHLAVARLAARLGYGPARAHAEVVPMTAASA